MQKGAVACRAFPYWDPQFFRASSKEASNIALSELGLLFFFLPSLQDGFINVQINVGTKTMISASETLPHCQITLEFFLIEWGEPVVIMLRLNLLIDGI